MPRSQHWDSQLPRADVTGARRHRRSGPRSRWGSRSEGPFREGECRANREVNNPRVSLRLRSHYTGLHHPPSHFTCIPHKNWEVRAERRAPRAEPQRGCAEHVRILGGLLAIGCDATSGVSGESREGEREREQAAGTGSRRAGRPTARREGASDQ